MRCTSPAVRVSIHAPRAGGDHGGWRTTAGLCRFNPRPPCGGRRHHRSVKYRVHTFQSTPPVRGATAGGALALFFCRFQSTPPVRGATKHIFMSAWCMNMFQSTPPVRGATNPIISGELSLLSFNPRPPCGGRQPVSNRRPGKRESRHLRELSHFPAQKHSLLFCSSFFRLHYTPLSYSRTSRENPARLGFAPNSNNQRPLLINTGFGSHMFNPPLPV